MPPAEPGTAAGMAVGDGTPKAGSRAAPGSGGGGGRKEKAVLVAAGEVVGRPLAVWSQKLMDWPKGTVVAWRAEAAEHLVRYEDPAAMGAAEQWVKLGSTRFQWLSEQAEGAAPNPTAASAPPEDDCVGRRLKVFWPGMGRWYQGKVQSFDPASRKHCIKYRDGDVQELRLRHEAIIWVDVGPMPPRPTPAQLHTPAAGGGKGGKAAGGGSGGSGGRATAAQRPGRAPSPAAASGGAAATRASPTVGAKRPRPDESSSGEDERIKSNKSSATRDGGLAGAAAAPGTAPAKDHPASDQGGGGGGSSNMGSAYSGQSLGEEDEGDAGISGSDRESGEEDDGDSSVVTDDLGAEVYSSDLDDERDSDFEVESFRNGAAGANRGGRRRVGGVAPAGAGAGRSNLARRRRSGGSRSGKTKKSSGGRPRKSGGAAAGPDRHARKARRDFGRPGVFRPTKPARPEDEAARMACAPLVGARVAVLWAQDQQYYKGKLLQFDSYHKRSKILYDDGEEEWISLTREAFKWLTPRGRSAGYAGEIKEALSQLNPHVEAGAGVGPLPAGAAVAPGATAPTGGVADVAAKAPPKAEAAVGWQVSLLFDGDGQWYRGEVLAFDRRRGRHLVLYDDGEDEWLQLERESMAWHKLARGASALCPGVKPGAAPPKGRAAVGWRVGVFWPLDMVFYTGEITAFDAVTTKHTIVYDDGEVRTLSLGTDRIKWIVPPNGIVDRSKLVGPGAEPNQYTYDAAAAARARKKGAGLAGESDPDYEFGLENRGRPAMRRLPRLLTTASLAGPAAGLAAEAAAYGQLPAEASMAQLLQMPGNGGAAALHPASPLYGRAGLAAPLSPTTEQPLGEPVLVRQLTRVPTLGSFSSGDSEATQLPNPITVRIYMSGSAGASGGSSGAGEAGAGEAAAAAGPGAAPGSAPASPFGAAALAAGKPAAATAGRQRRRGGMQSRLQALELMSRRVVRAQHTLVKGVPTHLPLHAPAAPLPASAGGAPGGSGPLSPTHHLHHFGAQQRSAQQLHRLARASTADHPLSPTHRRPHPALSDEEASSSSGSSDGESEREESPAALLSPRSAAAALNGAKVKPETQAQQAQQAQHDPMDLDAELLGGTVTPCDSDGLGPVPPLVRPAPQLDSPFSAGGLLRSRSPAPVGGSAGGLAAPPLQIYSGKPLFPDHAQLQQGVAGAGARAAEASHGAGAGGGAAPLGMQRSMSLTGGMLDSMALPPASDPMAGLLSMAGPSRHDSEFNLLAMAGPDLTPMDDGGLMELEVGVGVGPGGGPGGGELSGAAALVDPVLPA